ncbi:YopX family protein [Bacillus subtilis]|uniref:YopX family protein n=1 Tax=Bacillus subtilis TaxID=1423 RepID=UPI003CFB9AA0
MFQIPEFRVWDDRYDKMFYVNKRNPNISLEFSSNGWSLEDAKTACLITTSHRKERSALMRATDQVYTAEDGYMGDTIFEGDVVKQRTEIIAGDPFLTTDITGVVVMLEGEWVIDTGMTARPLFSEVATNEKCGNVFEHRDIWEELYDRYVQLNKESD